MKYEGQQRSSNIENRLGQSSGYSSNSGISLNDIFGGGTSASSSVPSSRGGLFSGGIGTIIIMVILSLLFGGGSSGSSFGSGTNADTTSTGGGIGDILNGFLVDDEEAVDTESDEYQDRVESISVVLKHLEDFWTEQGSKEGFNYRNPILVLYSGSTMTPGGMATKDMGPFYSPSDEKIYLDLSFADELSQQYGVKGDYAMAYVLAHEFGHHIQTILGISDQMAQAQQSVGRTEYNKLSVRMELQADYYAGMFTKYLSSQTYEGQSILDANDFQDAIQTAQAIGDDQLMQQATGYVNPDNFTHGTSEQRMAWLEAGYNYGDLAHGNTFNSSNLDNPN